MLKSKKSELLCFISFLFFTGNLQITDLVHHKVTADSTFAATHVEEKSSVVDKQSCSSRKTPNPNSNPNPNL